MAFLFSISRRANSNFVSVGRTLDYWTRPHILSQRLRQCIHTSSVRRRETDQDTNHDSTTDARVNDEKAKYHGPYGANWRHRPRKRVPTPKSKQKWSAADEALLFQMHSEGYSSGSIAEVLGRSGKSVGKHVFHMGLAEPHGRYKFTQEEDDLILQKGTQRTLTYRKLQQQLPRFSIQTLRLRHNFLRDRAEGTIKLTSSGKEYTPAEDDLLLELRGQQMPWKDISKHFPERSEGSLRGRYRTLVPKALRSKQQNSWTAEESEQLQKLKDAGHSVTDISALMQRSYNSIHMKLRRLPEIGTVSSSMGKKHRWTKAATEELLKLHARQCTMNEMVRITGRTHGSLEFKLQTLGLGVKAKQR